MSARVQIVAGSPEQQARWDEDVNAPMRAAKVVTFRAVLQAAAKAAADHVPFSFLRIGDRETAIIEYPRQGFGDPNVDSFPAFPAGWRISPETIMAFKPRLKSALLDADAVGVITWKRPQYAVRVASIERLIGGAVRCATTSLDMRNVEMFLDELRAAIGSRRVLCAGMEAGRWGLAVKRLGAAEISVWPFEAAPSITTWDQYARLAEWALEATRPGDVAFLAVGPWSDVLSHDIQRAGGVGLDLGHGVRRLPELVG